MKTTADGVRYKAEMTLWGVGEERNIFERKTGQYHGIDADEVRDLYSSKEAAVEGAVLLLEGDIHDAFEQMDEVRGIKDNKIDAKSWYVVQGWIEDEKGKGPAGCVWSLPFMGQHALNSGFTSLNEAAKCCLLLTQEKYRNRLYGGSIFRLPATPHMLLNFRP